jgi:predicted enzyme related to lactoylglutathione lyase
MASPVVHFQLCAEDVDTLSAFYRDVFGWRIAPRALTSVEAGVTGAYPYIESEAGGIPGGISSRIPEKGGTVLVIQVDDIAETMERVMRLGGRKRSPEERPERMALATSADADERFDLQEFVDPEGNLVGIIQR